VERGQGECREKEGRGEEERGRVERGEREIGYLTFKKEDKVVTERVGN